MLRSRLYVRASGRLLTIGRVLRLSATLAAAAPPAPADAALVEAARTGDAAAVRALLRRSVPT